MKNRNWIIGAVCAVLVAGALAVDAATSYSNIISVQTPQKFPAAPSNLAATDVGWDHITLKWTDNSNDEILFQVERAPSATGPWTVVGTLSSNVTTYTDSLVAPSTTYWYRVASGN